jgi:hypothetical protein
MFKHKGKRVRTGQASEARLAGRHLRQLAIAARLVIEGGEESEDDEYTTSFVPVVVDGFVREEGTPFRETTGEMRVTPALLIAQVALDLFHLNAGDLRYAAIYRKVYDGLITDYEADVEVIILALEDETKRREKGV